MAKLGEVCPEKIGRQNPQKNSSVFEETPQNQDDFAAITSNKLVENGHEANENDNWSVTALNDTLSRHPDRMTQ